MVGSISLRLINLCRRKDKHYFGKFQNNFPKDVMHLFPDNFFVAFK